MEGLQEKFSEACKNAEQVLAENYEVAKMFSYWQGYVASIKLVKSYIERFQKVDGLALVLRQRLIAQTTELCSYEFDKKNFRKDYLEGSIKAVKELMEQIKGVK